MSDNLTISVNKHDLKPPAWMSVDMVMCAVMLCINRLMHLMWGTFEWSYDRSNMYFLIVCVLKVVCYLVISI
jgi:hypothetical protein